MPKVIKWVHSLTAELDNGETKTIGWETKEPDEKARTIIEQWLADGDQA